MKKFLLTLFDLLRISVRFLLSRPSFLGFFGCSNHSHQMHCHLQTIDWPKSSHCVDPSPLSVFAVHGRRCHGVILTARLSVSLRAVNGKCARVISSHPAASLVIRRRFASFNSRHDDGRPLLLMATRNAQLGVRTQVRKIFELNLLSKQTNESTAIVLCSVTTDA